MELQLGKIGYRIKSGHTTVALNQRVGNLVPKQNIIDKKYLILFTYLSELFQETTE